jgi:hypothetical protein
MGKELDHSMKEELVKLVDSPFTRTLLEVRAEEIVQAVVSRWRTRALVILVGVGFVLGILGINFKSAVHEKIDTLTARLDPLTNRITAIDADLDKRKEEIGGLKGGVDAASNKLALSATTAQETTRQFLALAKETDSIRTSSWRNLLDDERKSGSAEIGALRKRVADDLQQLQGLRTTLEKERVAAIDVTMKADAKLKELSRIPTTTFVLLRRDIVRELKLDGCLVKATLKHTRGGEIRKGAELAFEVNEERHPPRILWENAVQLLEGTDYQVELMFVYDFPIFGKGVDFVMLKLSRGSGQEP